MSSTQDALVKRDPKKTEVVRASELEKERDFEEVAVDKHEAIERDKEVFESHLAVFQSELERGMDQVAEVRDKALDVKDKAMHLKDRAMGIKDHLVERAERAKDWEGLVRDYPWQMVGVSVALGFYLGSMINSKG